MAKIARCLILQFVVLTICGAAEASSVSDCEAVGKLAGAIMLGRQKGMTTAELTGAAKFDGEDPAAVVQVQSIIQSLVTMAYLYPRFESEERQQKTIVTFKASAYDMCLGATT